MKLLIRRGIPFSLRSVCWYEYSGASALANSNPRVYDVLCSREALDKGKYDTYSSHNLKFIQIIERDVFRTFPDNIHFKKRFPPPEAVDSGSDEDQDYTLAYQSQYVRSLRQILVAFSYYSWPHFDPRIGQRECLSYKIGYCQSMNFICGFLLLVYAQDTDFEVDSEAARIIEAKAFWTLVALIELLPTETYGADLSGAIATQEILWKWIVGTRATFYGLEKVSAKIQEMSRVKASTEDNDKQSMPPMQSITLQWYLTLFISVFPFDIVLRLWDLMVLFLDLILLACSQIYQPGEKIFMRLILTLLKINEEQILEFQDPIRLWKFVKDLPSTIVDGDDLLEKMFLPRSVKMVKLNGPEHTVTERRFALRENVGSMFVMAKSMFPAIRRKSIVRGVGSIKSKMIDRLRAMEFEVKAMEKERK